MDRAGEQVLPGPGLADDQHVAVGLRRPQRLLDRGAEGRIVAAQRAERAVVCAALRGDRDERCPADREVRTDAELGALDEVAVDARPVARPLVPHEQ